MSFNNNKEKHEKNINITNNSIQFINSIVLKSFIKRFKCYTYIDIIATSIWINIKYRFSNHALTSINVKDEFILPLFQFNCTCPLEPAS